MVHLTLALPCGAHLSLGLSSIVLCFQSIQFATVDRSPARQLVGQSRLGSTSDWITLALGDRCEFCGEPLELPPGAGRCRAPLPLRRCLVGQGPPSPRRCENEERDCDARPGRGGDA